MTEPAASPGARLYALFAVLILIWGINWPVIKVGLDYITPLWFAAARFALGIVSMVVFLAAFGRLRLPPRSDWPIVLSVGVLQLALFLGLVNMGLLHVEAGRTAVLAYTTPLWVTPGAALLLRERLSVQKLLGVALGFAGLAVLFNPLQFDWRDREVVLGNGLVLLAAVAWAAAILHVRGHRWRSTALDLITWQMILACVLLVPAAYLLEGLPAPNWTPELGAVLLFNGPIATAFCFWASVTVTRSLPAVTTSLSFLGVPVTGVIASALWLREPLTASLIGGLALILVGIVLVNLSRRRERVTP